MFGMTGERLTPVEGTGATSSHGGFPGPWGTTCIQTAKEQWLSTVMVPVPREFGTRASSVSRMAIPVANGYIVGCMIAACAS